MDHAVSGNTQQRNSVEPIIAAATAGVVVGSVLFLFWCQQAGFYGAFSVTPDRVGIKGGSAVQLSIGAAYVCFISAVLFLGLAGIGVGARKAVRVWRHQKKGRLPEVAKGWYMLKKNQFRHRAVLYAFLVTLTVMAGLVLQAVLDSRWQPRWETLAVGCCLGLVAFLAGWQHAVRNPNRRAAAFFVMAVVLIGDAGVMTNAWSYGIGLQLRQGEPSRATFLIGFTPPVASVEWSDLREVPGALIDAEKKKELLNKLPPGSGEAKIAWASPDEFLVLGTAEGQHVLFCRRTKYFYLVNADDVHLSVKPN
ncbi:hypothetical protein [Micromonospora chersina]|uniref:Uncharacterized protein n=1 Tax=Micromonospora chersina TaxID=47854 RepID=A0A1C6UHC2_9ACTN|nr:hypothetical protein [Micromonospora chersina]SCL53253.1 hypothetical protein GA0070603_1563 [Micromonospora chersina]